MSLKKELFAMKRLAILICLLATQFGFTEPKNSALEIISQIKGQKAQITFKIIPKKGILVTDEGPWKLTLQGTSGLCFKEEKGKFIKEHKDYDAKIPGFSVSCVGVSQKKGEFSYRLKAFVCTADKQRCFFETHKGTHKWHT